MHTGSEADKQRTHTSPDVDMMFTHDIVLLIARVGQLCFAKERIAGSALLDSRSRTKGIGIPITPPSFQFVLPRVASQTDVAEHILSTMH